MQPKHIALSEDTQVLNIAWEDGHKTALKLSWLERVCETASTDTTNEFLLHYKPWKASNFPHNEIPELSYEKVCNRQLQWTLT
jgi:hypothetical protein